MLRALTRSLVASLATIPLLAFAGGASAADEAPVPAPAPTPAPTAAPAPAPKAAAAKDEPADGATDHSLIVGRIGIGYLGQFAIPLGGGFGAAGFTNNVPSEVVGVRYWFSDKFGLDLGVGIGTSSGTATVTTGSTSLSTDHASAFALSIKAGVPIALGVGKHYAFILEPAVAYGHSSLSSKNPAGGGVCPVGATCPDTAASGDHFEIGAAAGAVVYFGFIGIPQLSLDATVGLHLDYQKGGTKGPAGGAPTTLSETTNSNLGISSISGHQPWNIFISNVAAIYYF